MKINWFKDSVQNFERLIIVGDVGGTNTNLGLAGVKAGKISLLLEIVFNSHEVEDFTALVLKTLETARTKDAGLKIDLCCISGAGPVSGNVCRMTNQGWTIDGNAIQAATGFPTLIINDFTAISYGLPLLDPQDSQQIQILRRPDGSSPPAHGDTRAVVGAGTGLGVGFLTSLGNDKYRAFPSEGGHMDFADFDADTAGLKAWTMEKIDLVPEYEMFISGMGIKNLFYFFLEKGRLNKDDAEVKEILNVPDLHKPALISKHSAQHAGCKLIMKTFVKMYARFASSVACLLLPKAGFYLAGGISGKNLDHFVEDNLFIETFETHCNPNIVGVLKEIPVYIVKDYSISLYGAANAALSLMV